MRETARILDISTRWSSLSELDSDSRASGSNTVFYGLPESLNDEQKNSPALRALELSPYVGLSFLVDCQSAESEIDSKQLSELISPLEEPEAALLPPRILIRTGFTNKKPNTQYPCLTGDALLYLQSKGIGLVGIDCPSIDKPEGHAVNSAFMKSKKMVWLANLDLSAVAENTLHLLVALPLVPATKGKVPTRAILIPVAEG